jgi:hypothetical protein|tara:strand:+ start:5419 stop:6030 length:612 start_codon:yes stop_codon:yes gene_type:complete
MQEEEKEKNGVTASLQKYDESAQADLLVKAETWIASGLLPSSIKKPEQAVVIALKGKELGLETMASFELIDVIMGKPALKPKGMASLIRKGGVRTKTIKDFEPILDEKGAKVDYITTIRFYRDGIEEDVSYTYRDAERLGLTNKDNWKKQPAVMQYWRCYSKGANRVAPDLINGLYTTEELSSFTPNAPQIEITEDGDAIVIQ